MLGAIITAEMFEPVVTGITSIVPIAVGVGASIMAVSFVAEKGFALIKGFINRA
ncbi:hypothetical protein [Enterococcus sp. BWR-S5]|uniref:hypothetical protein n=1 Tax=Enterococcus sp. BWR-S5 TaxID=2787714 RepID=UPI0019227713|nr:hypothetical protein [Enterococcus sp. BWR-S5]MBL1224578.1 hypothetical protein [Enterococcus sp. BWR-S5]MBL1224589.1 hypothetical protein [Enterococcus sp. BWR-S5]